MRCFSPISIRKNGQNLVVPCGRCNFCLASKRADWCFRIQQEMKVSSTANFLTLTYSNDHLPFGPFGPSLCKNDHQSFMKKLRKETTATLRYYAVGEYGTEFHRPHYHSIMFNLPNGIANRLEEIWEKGNVHVGEVTPASISYVTKYVINKIGEYEGREAPFATMSRRPGLGASYIRTHGDWHREALRNYTNVHGSVGRLPRYYKDKFFEQWEKNRIKTETVNLAEENERKEIERLSKLHPDPVAYYYERLAHTHAVAIKNLNTKNKF